MARFEVAEEGQDTLKRREKRRYILVMYRQQDCMQPATAPDALAAIERRHAELFGSIASARASLRLVRADEPGLMVIRCSLQSVDGVLASIALADPEMVTLDMSSSMRRLKRRNKNRLQRPHYSRPHPAGLKLR